MNSPATVEDDLVAPLRAAALSAGYTVNTLELLRVGNNYIFADRENGHVFRVPVRDIALDYLVQENTRLLSLAAGGAPILPPRQRDPIALSTGELATVWPLAEASDREPALALAPTLSKLHDVDPVAGLPTWEGFPRARRRLDGAGAGGVPSELVDEISGRLDRLEAEFPDWSTDTVVHGDAHTGNLMKLGSDHVLIDLDDLALGCPEIDLAPIRTSYSRFDRLSGTWSEFLEAYGQRVDLDLLDWFVRLRQLTMTAWLFTLWDLRKESQAEARYWVSTLDKAAIWNPL